MYFLCCPLGGRETGRGHVRQRLDMSSDLSQGFADWTLGIGDETGRRSNPPIGVLTRWSRPPQELSAKGTERAGRATDGRKSPRPTKLVVRSTPIPLTRSPLLKDTKVLRRSTAGAKCLWDKDLRAETYTKRHNLVLRNAGRKQATATSLAQTAGQANPCNPVTVKDLRRLSKIV